MATLLSSEMQFKKVGKFCRHAFKQSPGRRHDQGIDPMRCGKQTNQTNEKILFNDYTKFKDNTKRFHESERERERESNKCFASS